MDNESNKLFWVWINNLLRKIKYFETQEIDKDQGPIWLFPSFWRKPNFVIESNGILHNYCMAKLVFTTLIQNFTKSRRNKWVINCIQYDKRIFLNRFFFWNREKILSLNYVNKIISKRIINIPSLAYFLQCSYFLAWEKAAVGNTESSHISTYVGKRTKLRR